MERLRSEAADVSTAIDLEFGSLANSLVLLLEAAKSDLEHDHEAAKTSLATASSILQSEIERRSGLQGASTGGLAGWQIARVRSFITRVTSVLSPGEARRTSHARSSKRSENRHMPTS
jgi:hypothetical protein